MVFAAEQQPIHAACIEQKATDIVGLGWDWENINEDENSPDKQMDQLEEWFTELADDRKDETILEIFQAAVEDLETVGQGLIEIARDPQGKVKYLYHMPAHTCRFGRDGLRIVQIRQGKRRWFKRWVPDDDRVVGALNGQVYKDRKSAGRRQIGNEVLVIKRPSRRSSWYGIPKYISALGWITLTIIARDDNIHYFENRREPRWAIILSNLDDDPNLEDDLRNALKVDMRQPHRNIVIPIEGPGKIDFQQLTDLSKNDMSFAKLQDLGGAHILVAHKVPSDRLGMTKLGPLGGNVAVDANRIYKEAVVQPSQKMLAARVNRFIKHEGPIENPQWRWKPVEMDLTEEDNDLKYGTQTFQAGLATLNEARIRLGLEPLPDDDPRGDAFITELANMTGQSPENINPENPPETTDTTDQPTDEEPADE